MTLKRLVFSFWLLLALLALVGCSALQGLNLPTGFPEGLGGPTAAPTPTATATPPLTPPLPQATATRMARPTARASAGLVLWVPPQFAPDSSTPAGSLLKKRLADFSEQNDGISVQVRVKAESGPGSALDGLTTASSAAPLALPSVVALNQADLEAAALKGLIFPLDSYSKLVGGDDWYAYARSLARVQGAAFALPFAGDAQVLAYRPAQIKLNTPLADWTTVLRMNQALGFASNDPEAMFMLLLYQSAGGSIEDAQHRPALQADKLTQVLQIIADGSQRNVFPYWISQYETDGEVWQAYKDERLNAMITWASSYLSALPADTTAVPVPPVGKTSASPATGWGWAVADPDTSHRAMSVKLAEYLSESDFLAEWTEAAGYLPTRPSVLAGWKNQSLKAVLGGIAGSAQARPSMEALTSIGPVLRDAALQVLKSENNPSQAAKIAVQRLAAPESP